MSQQSRFGITWGSGEHGLAVENYFRRAAAKEKKKFPTWVKDALFAHAKEVLGEELNEVKAVEE